MGPLSACVWTRVLRGACVLGDPHAEGCAFGACAPWSIGRPRRRPLLELRRGRVGRRRQGSS
eukprot:1616470-Alexandrium_andersonii.AAC.1